MARILVGHALFAAAVFLLPATSAIKDVLGLGITWINPTLVLAAGAFFFLLPPVRPAASLPLMCAVLVSCLCGAVTLPAEGVYAVLREAIRLFLNLIWFWVVQEVVRRKPQLLLNILSVTVILQLIVAMLVSALMTISLQSDALANLYDFYGNRQVVWFGDFGLQRLMGTFFEGPAFGLFMFCSLVVFVVNANTWRVRSRLARAGLVAGILGIVGAFSDAIFLACLVLITGLGIRRLGKGQANLATAAMAGVVAAVVSGVLAANLGKKIEEVIEPRAVVEIGASGAERMYHLQTAMRTWSENPAHFLFGFGPGRYGEYASRTGPFPEVTTMQVTFAEWLAEYGLVGAVALAVWLLSIFGSARRMGWLGISCFGSLLLAVAFQANWKWEGWFMALAVLYIAGAYSMTPRSRQVVVAGLASQRTVGA